MLKSAVRSFSIIAWNIYQIKATKGTGLDWHVGESTTNSDVQYFGASSCASHSWGTDLLHSKYSSVPPVSILITMLKID